MVLPELDAPPLSSTTCPPSRVTAIFAVCARRIVEVVLALRPTRGRRILTPSLRVSLVSGSNGRQVVEGINNVVGDRSSCGVAGVGHDVQLGTWPFLRQLPSHIGRGAQVEAAVDEDRREVLDPADAVEEFALCSPSCVPPVMRDQAGEAHSESRIGISRVRLRLGGQD